MEEPGHLNKRIDWGSRDSSVVKSTELGSQHPHSSLQLSIITVSGELMPLLTPSGTRHAHGVHVYVQTNTYIHEIKKINYIVFMQTDMVQGTERAN